MYHSPNVGSVPRADRLADELQAALLRAPREPQTLSARVRRITVQLLLDGTCTCQDVADRLGLHPRTLQRRLRKEGQSFEAIKDDVRREVALTYLQNTSVPLARVSEILGYSETSVLSRNCRRWFAAPPRRVRQLLSAS